MPTIKPVIIAYKKPEIDRPFMDFLKKYQPLGLIITQESCHNPAQLQKFVTDFRDCVDREDAPISIDQEGGRAQRLAGRILFDQGQMVLKTHPGSRHWPYYPEAALIGQIYRQDQELGKQASRQAGRAIGSVLASLQIDLNYAPVIDICLPGANAIIGDRAYSKDPYAVRILAEEFIGGLHLFGVKSCIKHLPGHGRAQVDSHQDLPIIAASRQELEQCDFIPFPAFRNTPWLMVGHLRLDAL